MCNSYRLVTDLATLGQTFSNVEMAVGFSEGMPNIEARDEIRITDAAPIVRAGGGGIGGYDLVQRRWSWPGPRGRPVYNFRSEGREFTSNRCLIIADGFYEFTDPVLTGKKRKDKWLFTGKDEPVLGIAGIWRETAGIGEAFTMLTTQPGPDVAPYHDRQVVIIERNRWVEWLDPAVPARSLLAPLPAGSLHVAQVG